MVMFSQIYHLVANGVGYLCAMLVSLPDFE